MKVLVTGAAGRIGSHLTRTLLREGHTVRAFVLPGDPRAAGIAAPGVEFIYGRLEDRQALHAAVTGVEAVAHLGAALTGRGNTEEEFFEFNLRGTFNLLMAVRTQAPDLQRFVYASSDAVYSTGLRGVLYNPVDEAHPRLTGTVYGASKIGAEELCLAFWRGFGIPPVILRFETTMDAAGVIDPNSAFARYIFLREAIRCLARETNPSAGEVEALSILQGLDDGTEKLLIQIDPAGRPILQQVADARDVAEGCWRALVTPAAVGETFNLGGAAPYSGDDLVKHVAARTGLQYVTAQLPVIEPTWYDSSAKARAVLGYAPWRTVYDMVDEAATSAASRQA